MSAKSSKGNKREAVTTAVAEVEKRQKTQTGAAKPSAGALVPRAAVVRVAPVAATEEEDTDEEGALKLQEVDFTASDATSIIAKMTNTKPRSPPYRIVAAFEINTTDEVLAGLKLTSKFIGKKTPGASEGSSYKNFIFEYVKAVRAASQSCVRFVSSLRHNRMAIPTWCTCRLWCCASSTGRAWATSKRQMARKARCPRATPTPGAISLPCWHSSPTRTSCASGPSTSDASSTLSSAGRPCATGCRYERSEYMLTMPADRKYHRNSRSSTMTFPPAPRETTA